jgi:poly-gamma-glutamate capsule biosynthesis protein CapA/YwtB (metallophosphatase superfamily)
MRGTKLTGGGRIALALCLLGIMLTGLVLIDGTGPRGAGAVVVEARNPKKESLSIVWAGDTMLGHAAEPYVARHGRRWLLKGVAPLLDGDAAVVNAEGPITARAEPFRPAQISYAVQRRAVGSLRRVGVTALGLANNHAMDQGPSGLSDTLLYARKGGLATFGAGMNDTQAERPLIIRGRDVTVGVVALAKGYGARATAGADRAGTIPLFTGSIRRGYELARQAGADWVVGYVHWGENYFPVLEQERRDAAKFAAAGYDLVVGHGPHVIQGVDKIGSTPVLYSLGNFVFGTLGEFSDRNGQGLVLRTDFGPNGLEALKLTCIVVDNDRVEYQPQRCHAREADRVLGSLGVPVKVRGAEATVPRSWWAEGESP